MAAQVGIPALADEAQAVLALPTSQVLTWAVDAFAFEVEPSEP